MNISRFTQKSQEVIQLCEKTAMDYGHQEIAQEHLLYSMMNVDESLIRKLIEKMGIEPDVFTTQVESLLQKRSKVTGGELHIDQKLNETLIYAEDEAKRIRLDSLFSDKPVLRGCDSIVIYSSTSPEGNAAFNRKLSRERGNTLKNYILSNYPGISEEKVYVRMSDNSWSVFRRMVSDDTGMPGRESVLQIIDSHRSESDKVRAILASAAGSYVRRQLFPYLRSAQCIIWCFGDFVDPEPAFSAAKTESPEPGTVVETPKARPEIEVESISERLVIEVDKPENKCGLAFAVKTNAALLGATVANLGLEMGFCNGLSLDIPVLYSPYTVKNNYKLKVLAVQPELRYWLDRPFRGHFFGLHAHLGWFNVAVDDDWRYQSRGDSPLWGFGVSYGYALLLNGHWGLEFTLGAGYAHIPYEKYYNVYNGAQCGSGIKNYWGITRAGITLVYKFK